MQTKHTNSSICSFERMWKVLASYSIILYPDLSRVCASLLFPAPTPGKETWLLSSSLPPSLGLSLKALGLGMGWEMGSVRGESIGVQKGLQS